MDTHSPSPPQQKRLSLGLMTVAVLSSVVASTCCVVPLILVLVGITGTWMANLQALKPFVTVFTFIALTSLGWAGYLVFRPRPSNACTAEDAECATQICRTTRKAFIACATVIAALLLFPFAAPLFY